MKHHTLLTWALAGVALALGCSKDAPTGGPQTIRETGYLSCLADTRACGEASVLCEAADGTTTCVSKPAACAGDVDCACAGAAFCGEAACHDVGGGVLCGEPLRPDSEAPDSQTPPLDARFFDAGREVGDGGLGVDAPRPDAYLCEVVRPELGLSLSPLPAEPTGGDLVARTLAPDRVTLTVRTVAGVEDTYTLTGPFAGLPEEALPLGAHVNIQANRAAFVLRAGPCDWAPLEVISGSWDELAPLIGPVTPTEDPACACPRNSRYPLAPALDRQLAPGESVDTMQSHVTLGAFYGCAEDPDVPSRLEVVSVPRRDAPACPGGPANERGRAVDLDLTFAPEDDTPENRTQFLYFGLVTIASATSPDGVPGLDITPLDPPNGFLAAHVDWPSDTPLPVFDGDTFVTLERRENGFWTNTRVMVTDARGLALSAVDADGSWGTYAAGTGFVSTPAECLTRAEIQPGVFAAQDGHPVEIREADEGQPWPVVRLGDTEVTIRGQRYAVDVRASHTWQNACSTDDTGGWLGLALSRTE